MPEIVSLVSPYVVALGSILVAVRWILKSRKEIADGWQWVKHNILLRAEHHRIEALETELEEVPPQ